MFNSNKGGALSSSNQYGQFFTKIEVFDVPITIRQIQSNIRRDETVNGVFRPLSALYVFNRDGQELALISSLNYLSLELKPGVYYIGYQNHISQGFVESSTLIREKDKDLFRVETDVISRFSKQMYIETGTTYEYKSSTKTFSRCSVYKYQYLGILYTIYNPLTGLHEYESGDVFHVNSSDYLETTSGGSMNNTCTFPIYPYETNIGKIEIALRGAYGGGSHQLSYLGDSGKPAWAMGTLDTRSLQMSRYGTSITFLLGGEGKTTDKIETPIEGTYNGGGSGFTSDYTSDAGTSGGGATDLRLGSVSWNNWDMKKYLDARIMVAGGAGGGGDDKGDNGGNGGGFKGQCGSSDGTVTTSAPGGTQNGPYQRYGKGQGYEESGQQFPGGTNDFAGGGGGFYGGYGGYNIGAGGGSGYISGFGECKLHNSSIAFEKPGFVLESIEAKDTRILGGIATIKILTTASAPNKPVVTPNNPHLSPTILNSNFLDISWTYSDKSNIAQESVNIGIFYSTDNSDWSGEQIAGTYVPYSEFNIPSSNNVHTLNLKGHLKPDRLYYFQVKTKNKNGNWSLSSVDSYFKSPKAIQIKLDDSCKGAENDPIVMTDVILKWSRTESESLGQERVVIKMQNIVDKTDSRVFDFESKDLQYVIDKNYLGNGGIYCFEITCYDALNIPSNTVVTYIKPLLNQLPEPPIINQMNRRTLSIQTNATTPFFNGELYSKVIDVTMNKDGDGDKQSLIVDFYANAEENPGDKLFTISSENDNNDFVFKYMCKSSETSESEWKDYPKEGLLVEHADNEVIYACLFIKIEKIKNKLSNMDLILMDKSLYAKVYSKDMTTKQTSTTDEFAKIKFGSEIEFSTKPLETTDCAKRILSKIFYDFRENTAIYGKLQLFACNNAFDENPTWEEITETTKNKTYYTFTNKEKTADKWGISLKIIGSTSYSGLSTSKDDPEIKIRALSFSFD